MPEFRIFGYHLFLADFQAGVRAYGSLGIGFFHFRLDIQRQDSVLFCLVCRCNCQHLGTHQ